MNQTVSLCEFGTVERAFSPACQTNCFQGEASAAYDPCGNMISLVAQSSGVEGWSRAIDKNSDATIGIYNSYNMEIPFSAQATINPSYDQPINGPIEFHIPEQGQWDLKELLANMTRVNTTVKENGVDASIYGDDASWGAFFLLRKAVRVGLISSAIITKLFKLFLALQMPAICI